MDRKLIYFVHRDWENGGWWAIIPQNDKVSQLYNKLKEKGYLTSEDRYYRCENYVTARWRWSAILLLKLDQRTLNRKRKKELKKQHSKKRPGKTFAYQGFRRMSKEQEALLILKGADNAN